MKKILCLFLCTLLAVSVIATNVFAAEPRWTHVGSVSPSISANDGTYTSEVSCLDGTSKIEFTLILYEKGLFGNYTEVSRVSDVYYGHTHEFVGHYAIKSGTTYKLVTDVVATRNGSTEHVSVPFEKKC